MKIAIISFLVGIMSGMICMGVMSGRAYDKGYEDAKWDYSLDEEVE